MKMSLPPNCPVFVGYTNESIYRTDENTCQEAIESICGNSKSVRILEEFRRLYEERLSKIDEEAPEGMELKLKTLSSWVNDLGEQNLMLVETVEQLEQEAAGRVALLEERLKKSSHVAVEYMKKLEEYDNQFLDLSDGRIQPFALPIETSSKLVQAQQTEEILKTRVSNLQNDISGLLELIRRARCEGSWDVNGLSFLEVTYEDIFGSYSRQVSDTFKSLGDMQSRMNVLYRKLDKPPEDYLGKDQELKVLHEKVASQQADIALKDIQIKNLIDKLEELQSSIGNKTKEVIPNSEKMVFDHTVMSNIFSGVEEEEIASLKERSDDTCFEEMDLSTLVKKLEDTDIHLQTTREKNKLLIKENGCLSSDLKDKTDKIAVLSQNLTEVDKKRGVSFASPTKEDYKLQVQELEKSLKQVQNGGALARKQITKNNDCVNCEVQFAKHIEECRVNIVLAQAAIEETVEELETVADVLRLREEKIQDLEVLIECLQSSLIHTQEGVNILLKPVISNEEVRDASGPFVSYLTKAQAISQLLRSLKNELMPSDAVLGNGEVVSTMPGHENISQSNKEIDVLFDELSKQEKEVSLRCLEINNVQEKLQGVNSMMNNMQRKVDEYVHDKDISHNSQVQSEQKIKKLQLELESVQEDLEQCLKIFEPADMSSSDIE